MTGPAAVAEMLKREGVEFLMGYPVNSIIIGQQIESSIFA
jgi:hypothetical protein